MFAKLFSGSSRSSEAAMKDSGTLLADVQNRANEFDYVRFSFADINGTSRGKVVTGRCASKFLVEGVGIWAGSLLYAANGESPFKTLRDVVDKGNPSMLLVPDMHTFHAVPWASNQDTRFAEILCHAVWIHDKSPMEPCPRHVAMKQLDELHSLGFELNSAFETEFKLIRRETGEPIQKGLDYSVHSTFAKFQEILVRADRGLSLAGVNVEMMHSEYSDGQFEFSVEPKMGVDSADDMFILKHGLKDLSHQYGLNASFMAKLDPIGAGSGQHFNFSIFNVNTENNAFFDEKGTNNLSVIARHWIAGLLKHAGAICAICCPTVNCYRRLHQPWAPGKKTWGVQDRDAMIRVKTDGPKGTFIENRVPSGLCNPYLVMAVTVAAGIDGIQNRLEAPPHREDSAGPLPTSLQEALTCLEEDKVIVDALGKQFVEWFVGMKRECELVTLKDSDPKVNNEKALKAEVDYYDRLL